MEGEQVGAAEEAHRRSPEALVAREESRTKFEHLGTAQALRVARDAFPGVVNEPAGGAPRLPSGERIVKYNASNAAAVALPDGKHGVIESLGPIATPTGHGQFTPINLALHSTGSDYAPANSDVAVQIPKHSSSGVTMPSDGVSLTPVNAQGQPLGGSEGVQEGASVVYANTQTDTDTLAKPTTGGFEIDSLLRSVDSPETLYFKVGMPAGSKLVGEKGPGGARVVLGGRTIATIAPVSAEDAEGTGVPVDMRASGDTLVVTVKRGSSEYQYPIEVDPTVVENGGYGGYEGTGEVPYGETWGFYTENSSVFQLRQIGSQPPLTYEDVVSRSVKAGERAFFYYRTQGESKIFEVTAGTNFEGYAGNKMENVLGILNVHTGKPEVSQAWIENYGSDSPLCSEPGCASGTVTSSNDKSEIFYQQDERETNEWGGGTSHLNSAYVDIVQEAGPSATFIPVEKWTNNLGNNDWLSLTATDPGLGILSSEWTASSDRGWKDWNAGACSGVQCEECYGTTECKEPAFSGNLKGLPEGEDVIEATTKDPVGLSTASRTTVKIDDKAPYDLTLIGFPADHEISFGRYVVKVSATDGSGTTPSAGVASIKLAIDGKEVGTPRGSCSPGPCTATGEWVIDGEEYAAGKHTFTMTVTDGAGNVAKEEFPLTIESSESRGVGPGSVDLTSGAYTLNATDVSVAAPGGGLTVQRSYNSRHLTAGAEGPLGPQWSGLGMGGTQSLAKLPTGSMLLTAANGAQAVFAKEGATFVSPTGDVNLTLKETEANVFTLTEQKGPVTTFTLPSGGSGTLFTPYTREEPGIAGGVKYTYQTVGGITEPTQALAPVPAGVSCSTLVKGCRALTFSYASSTTATGENESEWGEYAGRLVGVSFTAWDPSTSKMTTTPVAQYSYDQQGRLRAEWDPRISPALKTTYGYDSEGHVVSLTAPGQETWALTYTSIPSDLNTGRLLKAVQAPASAKLWSGQALANTEAPELLGTAMVGNRMGVSDGAWSGEPVTYGYQWQLCSGSGGECAPIAGAVNPNYTPVEADVGHTLMAVVTAINGEGSVTATSATSGLVSPSGAPLYISSVPLKSAGYKAPAGVAVTSEGNVWVADTGDDQIVEFNKNNEFLRRIGTKGNGPGQFSDPTGIAVDSSGDVWVADTGNNRIEEFNGSGEYLTSFGSEGTEAGEFKAPCGVAVDSSGNVWVADTGNYRVQEFNEYGGYESQFEIKGGPLSPAKPTGITVNSSGDVWVSVLGTEAGITLTWFQEYNEQGESLRLVESGGEGGGRFKDLQGIAVSGQHVWIVDTTNNRVEEFNEKGEYQNQFGTKGEDNGQLDMPSGLAVDSKGNVWVADTVNNRIQEFNEKGEYQAQFDNEGTPRDTLSYPAGVTSRPEGGVWVADPEKDKVYGYNEQGEGGGEFGAKGTGTGEFSYPVGAASNAKGDVWVADSGNQRVEEFNDNGSYMSEFGSGGTGNGQFSDPDGVAVDSKGNIWVADTGNDRVEEFNEKGEFLKVVGSAGTGNGQFNHPNGVAVNSNGDVWVVDTGNDRVEEFNEKGEFLKVVGSAGTGNGQFIGPYGVAVDSSGNVWVADAGNDRVQEFNEKGEYVTSFGEEGQGPGQFNDPLWLAISSSGSMWVSDTNNNRAQHWQVTPRVEAEALLPAPGVTVEYDVPLSGSGAPESMSGAEVERWGQKDDPAEATAIFPPDEPQTAPASDYRRATVFYLDSHGRTVNVASPGGAIATSEYNSTNDIVRTLSPDNRAAALKEGSKSAEESKLLDTESTYNSEGTELQSTLGPQHVVKLENGAIIEARDHQQYSYDEGAPSEGGPYGLVTKVTDGAQYSGKEENVRTTTTSYSGQENLGWKLRKPTSVTVDPNGLKLTHTTLYEATTGNVIETRMPAGNAQSGKVGAHDTQTIYYTDAANKKYSECGKHPQWANLPCRIQPAEQPETSGLPNLPVTTMTYNVWDEPETTTETVGSTTRTKTATYDAAGRLKTSTTSSTVGTALPTVTYEYNVETGALEKQSTTVEGRTEKLTNVFNTIGELASYTDADENTSTYSYDIDGRVEKVSDGKGTQAYTYDSTTGDLTKLVDSAAGTFTGAYDVEGNLLTEGYPNGMNANYTYNPVGAPVDLEYIKTTHCTEKCTWFSDAVVPSIHGQWLEQTSTLSHQAYTYDTAGRLTQVQNTPTGKGCTTRIYAYDEDTNRLSLTTREPGAEGKCASEGGTIEKHSYDAADRLTDAGIVYNTFGDITSLPAADAGGTELTSTYYTDNQLASETQNGQTIGFNLDPAGRTRETVKTGKVATTVVSHYAGPDSAPAWTVNTGGEWTRNIGGINGGLAAVQNGTESPVLQIENLQGDIVGTAYLSETASGLASTADTSEYGVPTLSLPPKYSWLGADEIPTELASGVLDMGARSYVPQLGRFLQPDPRPGGSANAYSYTFGDPVNSSDPSGEYTLGGPSQALINGTAEMASNAVAEQAAINAAARAEAERKAAEAAGLADMAGPQYEGEEEEYEDGEEEYEEVSYSAGTKNGHGEALLGSGLSSEPFANVGEDEKNENKENGEQLARLCGEESSGPCRLFVGKKKKKKRSSKYNACLGRKNPKDPDEGCCVSGKKAVVCDERTQPSSSSGPTAGPASPSHSGSANDCTNDEVFCGTALPMAEYGAEGE